MDSLHQRLNKKRLEIIKKLKEIDEIIDSELVDNVDNFDITDTSEVLNNMRLELELTDFEHYYDEEHIS